MIAAAIVAMLKDAEKKRQEELNRCDCSDCLGSEMPCSGDCEEELCQGCFEAKEAAKDREHDEMTALGYK